MGGSAHPPPFPLPPYPQLDHKDPLNQGGREGKRDSQNARNVDFKKLDFSTVSGKNTATP